MKYLDELSKMIEVSKKASSLVLDYYHHGFHVERKSDDSPVTEADKNADKLIREFLHQYFPTYSFLTEEHADNLERLDAEFVFIVDPVDGTKDFVNHDDEFSINIALCHKHRIVASVTAIPVFNLIYYALRDYGAYKLDLNTNETTKIYTSNKLSDLTVYKSRYHSFENEEELFKRHSDKIKHVICAGSAYKICLIAEGKGELSYRLNRGTKEWDTASFDLLIEEAGGVVLDLNKERILYNRKDPNNDTYIVLNDVNNWIYP